MKDPIELSYVVPKIMDRWNEDSRIQSAAILTTTCFETEIAFNICGRSYFEDIAHSTHLENFKPSVPLLGFCIESLNGVLRVLKYKSTKWEIPDTGGFDTLIIENDHIIIKPDQITR
ncbi:MAG TPA: hypothetical protein PKD55_09425 [Bellilinea sp.]|nr:hypothetical protein [Bellilinea sp.]